MFRAILPLIVAIGSGAEGVAMDDVIPGNNRFAFDLYARLHDRPGNLFFSPYSISTALAMTSLGARGQTALEMARTLHLPADPKALEAGFAGLFAGIGGAGNERHYQLATANALWGQSGLDYRPEFLQQARAGFGAGLEPVDFAGDPQGARATINAWVAKQTLNKIPDLLAPSSVSKQTDLILTNAIYFKAQWTTPFPGRVTRDEPFHAGPTSDPVPMMHLISSFGYAETDDLQVLELPYLGNEVSAVVLLPRKVDGLTAVEATLSAPSLDALLAKLARQRGRSGTPSVQARVFRRAGGHIGRDGDAFGLHEGRRFLGDRCRSPPIALGRDP